MILERIFCRLRLIFDAAKGFDSLYKNVRYNAFTVIIVVHSKWRGWRLTTVYKLSSLGNFHFFQKGVVGHRTRKGVMRANWGRRHAVLGIGSQRDGR